MKTKIFLVGGLVLVIGVVVASVVVVRREATPRAATKAARAKSNQAGNLEHPALTTVVEPTAPETVSPEPASPPPAPFVKPRDQPKATAKLGAEVDPTHQDPRLDDPAVKEQLGRFALNFVGADPDADAAWAFLIYDTSLSESVREDLMEDLNENGFSAGDGRVATVEDLPLIESRIALLEEHMPDADEFMLAHLAEAYKDLVNMWTRLSQE